MKGVRAHMYIYQKDNLKKIAAVCANDSKVTTKCANKNFSYRKGIRNADIKPEIKCPFFVFFFL